MSEAKFLEIEGVKIAVSGLNVPKAAQFATYLANKGAEFGARLIETCVRRDAGEVVVFEVRPERPQDLAYDIRRVERLGAIFDASDQTVPGMYALRPDFPLAPHINQTKSEFPRSLCLYDEAYEDVRLKWTPATFLKRIFFWLSETAKGTLHAKDQPLEPLILASRGHLTVPADFLRTVGKRNRLLHVVSWVDHEGEATFVSKWVVPTGQQPVNVAVPVVLNPQIHGVIRHAPSTLAELDVFCQEGGVDLVRELGSRIRDWLVNKPFPAILDSILFLILVLPKTRTAGGKVESREIRGFLTQVKVQEVGMTLGAIDKSGATAAYVIGEPKLDRISAEKVLIEAVQVHLELEPRTAAEMNGGAFEELRAVAVGAGAIGSQILNNLVRGGFGTWTIVEPDVFLPHNAARHLLPAGVAGMGKGDATARTLNHTILNGASIEVIPASILAPGRHEARADAALGSAALVCDFSASVSVARFLGSSETKARHISAYLNPDGGGLVVAAEDNQRRIRLDWLEMMHYRAILNEPLLRGSLQSSKNRVRYGNSCRDLSFQLAQDDVAIWSGVASKTIKRLTLLPEPALEIYSFDGTGVRAAICPELTKVRSIRCKDWTVRIDGWFVAKLAKLRADKLPNETGGVLLGHFDTHSRICSLVDVLPSPPDSSEWPTNYIRGVEGLSDLVADAEIATLGQIGYAGEWHSHPRGCPATPSRDDLKAYTWLCEHMNAEALPGLMLIVTDRKIIHFVDSQKT